MTNGHINDDNRERIAGHADALLNMYEAVEARTQVVGVNSVECATINSECKDRVTNL